MNQIYQTKKFAEKWDKYQRTKEDYFRTRIMNQIILKEIGSLKNKKVLEAGCGNGFFIDYLLKLNPKQIYGFDISPYFIDIVKKRYPNCEFKIADIMKKLPYSNNKFDCVVCYNVLMDIPKMSVAIKELKRVINKKGFIHIIIVHPLYNLFINEIKAKKERVIKRLTRYLLEESILVDTLPGFNQFKVYRRPISMYINEFIKNQLIIDKMIEIPISKKISRLNKKYKERIGIPVFLYFKLKKS